MFLHSVSFIKRTLPPESRPLPFPVNKQNISKISSKRNGTDITLNLGLLRENSPDRTRNILQIDLGNEDGLPTVTVGTLPLLVFTEVFNSLRGTPRFNKVQLSVITFFNTTRKSFISSLKEKLITKNTD